jgi:hypothetical protein
MYPSGVVVPNRHAGRWTAVTGCGGQHAHMLICSTFAMDPDAAARLWEMSLQMFNA